MKIKLFDKESLDGSTLAYNRIVDVEIEDGSFKITLTLAGSYDPGRWSVKGLISALIDGLDAYLDEM